MKIQSKKMLLIMGEFSRDSVGIPPEVNTDFNNENRRNVEGNLPKLLRHPSGIQTNFDNEK